MNLDTADKLFRIAVAFALLGVGAAAYGVWELLKAIYLKVIKPRF